MTSPPSPPSLTIVILLFCFLLSACGSSTAVLRKRGTEEAGGRPIPSTAYAWYVRGLSFERKGDFDLARQAFLKTVRSDEKSGAAWAALGRVTCRIRPEEAASIFKHGLTRATRKAPILIAQGHCALSLGKSALSSRKETDEALKAAHEALKLEPESASASELLAQVYAARSDPVTQSRVERAFYLYVPRELKEDDSGEVTGRADVDAALLRGDLQGAQRAALGVMSPGALSARALAWGQTQMALLQAEFVLSANPHDPDALITWVINSAQIPRTPPRGEPSEIAELLFAQHLARNLGPEPAIQFLSARPQADSPSPDPLAELLTTELHRSGVSFSDPSPLVAEGLPESAHF